MKKIIGLIITIFILSGCSSQLQVVSEPEPAVAKAKSRVSLNLTGLDSESAKQLLADTIESDIRQELSNVKSISLSREKNIVTIWVKGEYTFDGQSANLPPQISSEIEKIAALLSYYPQITIRIEGHTDNVGTEWYNLKLSRLRAEAVKSIFIKNNFRDSQVSVAPFGESYPIASNSTEQGRKANRRIVIHVIPSL